MERNPQTIYVIVHEAAVEAYADSGSLTAKEVLEQIERIKAANFVSTREVPSHHSPFEIPDDLPFPSSDLQILVLGGYTATCCLAQAYALKRAGYVNVRIDKTACCPGQGRLPNMLLDDINEQFPELIEQAFDL